MITEFKSSAKRRKREHQQQRAERARRHSWAGRTFFCNSSFSAFIQGGIINSTSVLTLLKQRRSTINIQKKRTSLSAGYVY